MKHLEQRIEELEKELKRTQIKLKLSNESSLRTYDGMAFDADLLNEIVPLINQLYNKVKHKNS